MSKKTGTETARIPIPIPGRRAWENQLATMGKGAKPGGSEYAAEVAVIMAGMPRGPRHGPAGLVYHLLNRSAGRIALFRREPALPPWN